MARSLRHPFSIFTFLALSSLYVNLSSCMSPKLLTASTHDAGFSPALATWYGDETGSGSGGACGWADDVEQPPFLAMIAAGNANIFKSGKGCGNCYEVKCLRTPYCSGNPITVTITDECPGACNNVPYHFDLSGLAFGAMASQGQEHNLRELGQVDIQYRRVPCSYGGTKISFKIDAKTNRYWFATAIEYTDGDGGITSIDIKPGNSDQWMSMQNIWGAVWKADINPSVNGPYSFRITSAGKTIVAVDAVPYIFVPGSSYSAQINF